MMSFSKIIKWEYGKEKMIIIILVGLSSACVMGMGLYIPQIYTSIVKHLFPHFTNDQIDARASTYKSFMDGSNAIIGLFLSPILGGLADVYGRKKIMIVGAISLVLCIGALELAYIFNLLWMTYVSCIFSISMVFQICGMAYMSDISKDENEKSFNFGLVFAAYMLGIIFGAFVLSLLGKFGISVALISLACICIVMTVFLALLFEEKTNFYGDNGEFTEAHKLTFSSINPFSSIRLILGMDVRVSTLVVVFAINYIAISDSMTSGFLYTYNRYGWGSGMNGVGVIVGGVSSMIFQAIGVKILLKFISRQSMLAITMYFAVFVHCLQGYAPVGWVYMIGIVASGFVAIGFPVLQSLFSERIPKEQQGIAFGGLSGIGSIATFVGALLTENIFSWCLLNQNFITCPGTSFYVCGFLFFVDGCICLIYMLTQKQSQILQAENYQKNVEYRDSNVYVINNEEQPLLYKK